MQEMEADMARRKDSIEAALRRAERSKKYEAVLSPICGKTVNVKKVGRGVWTAHVPGQKHVRWGNKSEIRSDLVYFYVNCALPRARRTMY